MYTLVEIFLEPHQAVYWFLLRVGRYIFRVRLSIDVSNLLILLDFKPIRDRLDVCARITYSLTEFRQVDKFCVSNSIDWCFQNDNFDIFCFILTARQTRSE